MNATILQAAIERAKREVSDDVNAGRVPGGVRGFAELHDYVDANYYGGAFESAFDASDEGCAFWNNVQEAVDAWIKSGGLRSAAPHSPGGRPMRLLWAE